MDIEKMIIPLYLMMIAGHIAHVFEEVWGRFWLMNAVYGLGWYLVANWVLFCIPLVLLYFIIREKRRAYYLSILYGVIMIANGFGHNVATLLTRRYFDGFAGGFTGIGLILVGIPFIYSLWRKVRTVNS